LRAFTRDGTGADTLRRALRGTLHEVVAFDGYCVNTADPATLAVTSSVGDGLSAEDASRLFAIEHAGTDVNRLSDLARSRAPVATIGANPERSERMRALFLPRGWVDELRAALTECGRCWGYLHLFRGSPFTRQEVAAVRAITKDLAVALREALVRVPLRAAVVVPGVVVIGDAGRVLATTTSGAALVASLPRDARHEGLPHAVLAVASQASANGASATSHVPTADGLLRVVATAESNCAVVVIDRARARDVTSLTVALRRLSSREQEVCRALLRGLSDDEIGLALGIETETVKSHAKTVYAKLGVIGRGGLLALADEPPG